MKIKIPIRESKTTLKEILHRNIASHTPARSSHVLHASDVTNEEFCVRERQLLIKHNKKAYDSFYTTSELVTFHIGRVLQDSIYDWLPNRLVVSDWECVGCGHMVYFSNRPKLCGKCKFHLFKPHEIRFKSKVSGISCGVDLLFKFPDLNKLTPIEIKTIDKEKFKELVMPLAEHRLRTNLYLRLISESGSKYADRINTDFAYILYITKGGYGIINQDHDKWNFRDGRFSPFKCYFIKRDDKQTDYLYEKVKPMGGKKLAPRICDTPYCKRAVKCSVNKECFK